MQQLPHTYKVSGTAGATSNVTLSGDNLADIESAPPAEFGGPGNLWSPESLLVAAVADCFVLTFRAIAAGSKLEWSDLSCDVDGVLDRVERVTKFTTMNLRATLTVPEDLPGKQAAYAIGFSCAKGWMKIERTARSPT